MLNVFLKDVRSGAIFLWAVVPLNVVAALQVSRSGGAFLWANVACAAFMLVGVSMLDWKNGAEPFVHSLPVTRTMVVRGRYLTAAAVGLLSLSIASLVGVARGIGFSVQGLPWPRWVVGDTALSFVVAFALIAAIYLPCYYRWGFGRGNIAAALLLALGTIAGSVARDAATGLLPASEVASAVGGVPAGVIPAGVARLAGAWGLAMTGAVTIGVAAALLWLSSWVAVAAYRRREF